MKRQQGAALIVVLSLLTISLMVGLSSMQSSQIDERLAGNYKAASQAQMGAEEAASMGWDNIKGVDDDDWISLSDLTGSGLGGLTWEELRNGESGGCAPPVSCYYRYIEHADEKYIVSVGSVNGIGGQTVSLSEVVFVEVVFGTSGQPFEDAVTGCEGLSLGGGTLIDSYNSSYGAYGVDVTQDGETFTNSLRSEAVIRTVSESSDLALSGNSPVYGNVYVTGDLSLNSGTPVYGDVHADGSVNMNGKIYGDLEAIGDINFGTASMIEGETVSEGDVVVGATGTPPANISANGSVSYPSWWQWDDSKMALAENYHGGHGNDISQPYSAGEDCDTIGVVGEDGSPGEVFEDVWGDADLQDMSDWFDINSCEHCYSLNGGRFSFSGGSGRNDASTTVLGKEGEKSILRIDSDVTTGGRLSELQVRGDVTLIVDGDFDLGNNTSLSVGDASTLSLYVTGKTKLGGGSKLLSDGGFVREVDGEKKPAVMLYSAYGQFGGNPNSSGITLSGSNDSYMSIYAPNTDAVITGSGSLFGSIRSGYIDMRGSGDIHYDEALKDLTLGGGDGGSQQSIESWR